MNFETLMADMQATFSPEAIQNPHPAYARARRHGGLVVVPEWHAAFAFGLDAVNAFFKHPSSSADRLGHVPPEAVGASILRPMMLFHDGASHARLRGLVSQAFTPRAVAETREFIAGLTDQLLQEYATRGGDFISSVAVPLPMLVIAQLLGLDDRERERFRTWADTLVALLDGVTLDESQLPKIERDVSDMRAYFREVADEMRAQHRPGVLAAMARAEADGQRLSSDELLANAALLLAAGFETTTNLIAGGLVELSRNPPEWHKLLERPDLVPNAVEELLRFVSPVQATSRLLSANAEWNGITLEAGFSVNLMLGAANRDPARFAAPETLDLGRHGADRHVAFASGAHYCLGAPLARLEAQVFFERLSARYPDFRVPEQQLVYRNNFSVRGLTRLEVELAHKPRLERTPGVD